MDTLEQKPNTLEEPSLCVFNVVGEEVGTRLDAYLAARIEGWSRARIQRLIEDGDVLVGGRGAKASYKLRLDDEIEVELTSPAASGFAPEDIPLEVMFEDEDLVVINKPAGMVVHPAASIASGTLANALAYRFLNANSGLPIEEEQGTSVSEQAANLQVAHPHSAIRNPQSHPRPGIVHRLDRDTSGLIVVAKTEVAHENLSDQFRARGVFKSYVALVHGRFVEENGRIDQPIGRDPSHRTRMAVVRGGRPALTLYRVRRRYDRFTLLDVEIKTGRTHQIRVHLQWQKHPVVGDAVYGDGRDKTVMDARVRACVNALGRQFLHAEKLGFRHPRTEESLLFTAPLPEELGKLLEKLD